MGIRVSLMSAGPYLDPMNSREEARPFLFITVMVSVAFLVDMRCLYTLLTAYLFLEIKMKEYN